MQFITWLSGVICQSLGSLLFLSFLSLLSPPSPFHFSLLLRSFHLFLSPFCISSIPTDPTIDLMAPLQSLPLSYLLKSLTTEHLSGDAFQCPRKGCIEQRQQDLTGRRTGICKKSYRQERLGVLTLVQAKVRAHHQQWLKEFSTAFLPGTVSSRKIIFHSHNEKSK